MSHSVGGREVKQILTVPKFAKMNAVKVGWLVVLCKRLNVKSVLYQTIQFSVSTVSMSKIVSFQTIQFSTSTQFVKNFSISS